MIGKVNGGAAISLLESTQLLHYALLATIIYLFISICTSLRSSLIKLPGRWISKISSLPLHQMTHAGQEASVLASEHASHGPVVLLSPVEVSIADGRALQPIYVQKGGFRKADYYRNFDIDGHATIFSETDPEKRAPRAKAVLGMFSLGSIRKDGWDSLKTVVDQW